MLTVLLCLSVAVYAPAQGADTRSALAAARVQLAHGDLQGAEKVLWTVLSSEPENQEALILLGVLRGRQRRYLEAESVFRRVLQLNPKSAVACTNLADALWVQGKLDQAVEQYRQAQLLAPLDPEIKVNLARLYVQQGRFAETLSTLNLIPPNRFPLEATPLKASSLLALGRRPEAVALIARAKDSPAIAMDLAEVFLNGKLPQEASRALALVPATPRHSPARFWYLKGRVQQETGQAAAALTDFRRALALDSRSIESLIAVADIYAAENKHREAVDVLSQARAFTPDASAVLRRIAVEGMKVGENRMALQAALELDKKGLENLDDKYLVASILLQEQDYVQASQIFEAYLAQRPQDSRAWLGLGLACLNQQDYFDARNAFERSLQLDSGLTEAEYELGVVASREGRIAEAIQRWEDVVKQQPQHAKALLGLGTLYLQGGELDKAQSAFQRSEAADPTDPDTQYQMGLLANRLGNVEEGQRHMERFRELKQDKDRARQKDKAQQPNTR